MFEIGTKVVCVNDKFPPGIYDIYNALPRKGQIYTVRDIIPAQEMGTLKETAAVLVKELRNKPCPRLGVEYGFQCHRFREPTKDELKLALEKKNKKTVKV